MAFREYIFGHVENDKMILNEIGEIVQNEFIKSFAIRSELSLGKFVLMPNHLHAIVGLENPHPCRDARPCVSTATTSTRPIIPHRQPKSISSFVAGFKSATIQKINDWIDSMDSVKTHGIV
jgi:REP element-mobilizing transposase RayT